MIKVEKNIAGRPLKIESGQIARQAGGSVFISYGETVILATVCCSPEPREGIDFLPMQVEYREKHYAGGKIPGGFFKREAKPTDAEVLTSRLTDRPIRPLIPKNYRHELQIMLTTMSYDGVNTPDIVAAIGASAALLLSPVPFDGPIASVKIGLIDGEYVLNPTNEQMESSDLDLIVTGKKDKICMIEGGSNFVPEKTILEALDIAMDGINDIVDLQMEFSEHFDNSYEIVDTKVITEDIEKSLDDAYLSKMEKIFDLDTKQARDDKFNVIEKEALEPYLEDEEMYPEVKNYIKNMFKNTVRKTVLDKKVRVDGRGLEDIRDISVVESILPRAHGSALFTRGETQSIAALTLGSSRDEQIIDSMASDYKKSFLLHYNFPPYSVGEVGRIGFTNRREIGHGHLAERSLKPILPSSEEFPYTVRIVSEITESNGSSSMASVCGGSLAMMNAGVPIKEHVAGIAMGLIMEDDDNYAVLSDILGTEDFLGDMDFKVAGTKDGISAIQLDLKVPGLSMDILSNALEQANKGRLHILGEMNKAIDKPNALSQYAPQIESFKIDKDKIGALIGPGGKNIKALQENAECVINIEDDGTVSVSAENKAKLDNAISQIKAVVQDPEVGSVFDGKVTKILDFGAFVEFAPGREGLVHISQLAWKRVNKVEDVLSVGDEVKIKLFEIDKQGRLNFSIKLLTEKPE
ncbi:MAG: polyribonucleotide nucleotidyltransferase [Candidatus Marinimicrobia bacterium]|nr:polyribonucleotide nucleotidyltransferase [Candidatus Neomarinimicrobiota bacterium]MBL6826427.1 polyribonucleotide nucleotidyltransferase [Candidatus Neomarinimicrobiota bacterium]